MRGSRYPPAPTKNLNVSRCIPLFLFHLSLKAALPCGVPNKDALRSLAKRLNRRVDCQSLARVIDTEHQARLPMEKRLQNLRDAFAVPDSRWIRGRTVLLVDDVMTTGATLSHGARALLKAGAARVWCATVARAVLRSG